MVHTKIVHEAYVTYDILRINSRLRTEYYYKTNAGVRYKHMSQGSPNRCLVLFGLFVPFSDFKIQAVRWVIVIWEYNFETPLFWKHRDYHRMPEIAIWKLSISFLKYGLDSSLKLMTYSYFQVENRVSKLCFQLYY